MTVRERFAEWFASAAFTRGGCEERFLRNVAELAYLAAWSAAREEAARVCGQLANEARDMARQKRAEFEFNPEASAWDCASLRLDYAGNAIRSRLDAASRDGGV